MAGSLIRTDRAMDLIDMLDEWSRMSRRERTNRRGDIRPIPNRSQYARVTGRVGEGIEGEPPPRADWQLGILEHPEIRGDPVAWEAYEVGHCWLFPAQGGQLDVGRRYHVLCVGMRDEDAYPVYSATVEHSLWGVLASQMVAGGSADMRIRGNPAETLTAWDLLLNSGESIASGTRVTVFFDPVNEKWYVTAAQCPVGTGGGSGGGGTPPPPDPPPPPPPPTAGCGECAYLYRPDLGGWLYQWSTCSPDCVCPPPPTEAGSFGELRTLPCVPA